MDQSAENKPIEIIGEDGEIILGVPEQTISTPPRSSEEDPICLFVESLSEERSYRKTRMLFLTAFLGVYSAIVLASFFLTIFSDTSTREYYLKVEIIRFSLLIIGDVLAFWGMWRCNTRLITLFLACIFGLFLATLWAPERFTIFAEILTGAAAVLYVFRVRTKLQGFWVNVEHRQPQQ